MNQSEDKFEIHYRQQLSAMIDGDLAPDEARFLLRRLQHDTELNGCWERWQLCGDVLRGQAQAPAPAGFAERVAAAIAADAQPATAIVAKATARPRRLLAKWGGGALAASFALVALFMARQQVPTETPAAASVASQEQAQPAPLAEQEASDAVATAPLDLAGAAAAVAAVAPRKAATSTNRGSATRNQQVARAAARRNAPAQRATGTLATAPANSLVAAAPQPSKADAFRPVIGGTAEPAARPWPRSTLSSVPSASGVFNASFGSERSRQSFHPFEPQLQQNPPIPVPVSPQN